MGILTQEDLEAVKKASEDAVYGVLGGKDLKNIGDLFDIKFDSKFDEKFTKGFFEGFSSVWEQNMAPGIEGLVQSSEDKLKLEMSSLRVELKQSMEELKIELKRDGRDTRDYIAKKISELDGKVTGPAKRLDQKITVMVETLEEKNVFTADDVQKVKRISLFEQA